MAQPLFFTIFIGIIALEYYVLTNTKYFWLGGILPALVTVFCIFLMVKTNSYAVRDFLMIGTIAIGSLCFWGAGDERHKRKIKQKQAKSEQKNSGG
ncbi:hypothetical protein [Holzapfeliella sp. JNUCC 72]